ncbi:MAG: arginase family protein [Gaiellales bacterium]
MPDRPAILAVRARISEETPRDLRGVDLLSHLLERRLGERPATVEGRREPFGRTPWEDDLAASRETLLRAGQALGEQLTAGRPALLLASDCSLALGTLPGLAAARAGAQVLWLDAHCDYDTPRTTTIGFLGCMSLAGATGAWDAGLGIPLPAEKVVLCGVRGSLDDFDGAGRAAVEASPVRMLPPGPGAESGILSALDPGPVYVHFDPDVLDPSENPVPYARPGGLSLDQVESLLGAVAAAHQVLGVELTAFHSDDDPARREALGERLVGCLGALLGF